MGEIVAAVGTCHTPYMFTRPPDENPEQLDQAGRAMNELLMSVGAQSGHRDVTSCGGPCPIVGGLTPSTAPAPPP